MKINFEGTPINYEVFGEGEPILFLHGWGGEIKSFQPLYDYLMSENRIITLDFIGFGKSGMAEKPFSLDDYANSVLAIIEKEGIKEIKIIAHSFGGRVAIKLLAKRKELFSKAILFAPAGIKPRFSVKKFFAKRIFKLKKTLWRYGLISGDFYSKSGSSDYRQLGLTMKKTFVKVISEDLSKESKGIEAKTLIVHGEGDTAVPRYMCEKYHRNIDGSELIDMEGGHFCYLHNLFETYALVDSFFQSSKKIKEVI